MGYLKTNFDESNAENYVRSLIVKKPSVITTAVCYHFETRTRQVSFTDANGNTQYRTETYQERVDTWTGAHSFIFEFWKDNSDTNNIPLPKSGDKLRVKLTKEIEFSNEETKLSFLEQKERFASDNRHRDTHMDIETDFDIADFKEHMMAYDPQFGIPCWMNKECFVVSVFLCLSWPYRIVLQCATKKCFFKVLKEISIVPLETITKQPSAPPFNNHPPQQTNTVQYPDNDMTSSSSMMPFYSQPPIGEAPPAYIDAIQMNEVADSRSPLHDQQQTAPNLIGNKNSGYLNCFLDDIQI